MNRDESCMADEVYFFDSYAIFEVLSGNVHYHKYARSRVVTTKLNLFEVVSNLLKDARNDDALLFLNDAQQFVVDFDSDVIYRAALFWAEHRKQNLSMTDCIGYCLAMKLGVPFLTGDKEFEGFPHVEFVR